ncbi:MAG: SpoIIE family protein phosphatase [Streptosporangiales bacterium]|nr:SpoIIE family protein phosphatase [Streptosporangiales bacterium]
MPLSRGRRLVRPLLVLVILAGIALAVVPSPVVRVASAALVGGCTIVLAYALSRQQRRLAHMTRIAELTQRAIIRPLPREFGGLNLAAYTRSATAEALVGGDVHDAAMAPAGPRLIVADVKGGGLGAVGQATAVLAAFRQHALTAPDLARLATEIDAYIAAELGPEDFVTVILAEFASGEVRLVNCGHPPPLRIGRTLDLLQPADLSPPLGLHPRPRVQRYRLTPSQRLLLYTDGLTELRTASGRTGLPMLNPAVRSALTAPTPPEALDRLLDLLHKHADPTTDDVTLLLAQPANTDTPQPAHPTHDTQRPPQPQP